jgi:GAF domain-containing protein
VPKRGPKKVGESEETRFWDKISLVSEISAFFRENNSSEHTYTRVLTMIRRVISFDAATLFVIDETKKKLVRSAVLDGIVEILDFVPIGQGTGLTGWSARQRKPVLLSDRSGAGHFDPDRDYGSVVIVPLPIDDKVIGVINLGCVRSHGFREKDLKLIEVIADQLALSIERQQYVKTIEVKNDALQSARERLERAQEQLIATEKLSAVVSLAATINHQINNPLSVIVGNIQCMHLEQKTADQKTLTRLRRIEDAALRIRDVNQQLLEIHSLVSETCKAGEHIKMLDLERSASIPEKVHHDKQS